MTLDHVPFDEFHRDHPNLSYVNARQLYVHFLARQREARERVAREAGEAIERAYPFGYRSTDSEA